MISLIFSYGQNLPSIIENLGEEYEILVAGKPNRNLKKYGVKFVDDENLAASLIKCIKESKGDYIIFLNHGLKNVNRVIKKMVSIANKGADIVVGKRKERSQMAKMMVNLLLPCSRMSADPLSEIFLVKRDVVRNADLHPVGCKILLEILAKGDYGRVEEMPVDFRGDSRFNGNYSAYSAHLLRIAWEHGEIARFFKFGIVGVLSIFLNEFLLWLLLFYGIHLIISSILSIEAGILSSFILNEVWTFKDRGERGVKAFIHRMGKYNLASVVGLLINFFILIFLSRVFLINPLKANIVGIAAAFIWNFLAHNLWTWHN